MKMWSKGLAAAAFCCLASTAQADVVRFEMGAGLWQSDPDGQIQYLGDPLYDVVESAGFDKEDSPYVWAYLKHPIPVIPNIRLEYTAMEYSGNTKQAINWNGVSYGNAYNELAMNQLDGVLYYNLLDNTFWLTLDLGLQFKYVEGDYLIRDNNGVLTTVNEDFSGVLPLGYSRVRVSILESGLGVEAIGRGIAYSSNTIYDVQLKADYTLDMIPLIKPGLEVGYRVQKVKLDSDDADISADIDMDFSGFFAGATVRF